MSEPKWTPGPWRKMQGKYTDTYVIVAGDYANEGQPDMWAEVVTPNEMDASLIAAAPDLYEACDEALRFLDRGLGDYCAGDGGVEMWMLAIQDKLRDALRKARGESDRP